MGGRYGVAVRHRDDDGGGGCFSFVVGGLYGYVIPRGSGVGNESWRGSEVRGGECVFG